MGMATVRASASADKVQPLERTEFDSHIAVYGPRLRAALTARFGPTVADEAYADVLGYAWMNWERLALMDNSAGYLYRVGVTRGRRHRISRAIPISMSGSGSGSGSGSDGEGRHDLLPDLDLQEALRSLPVRQREVDSCSCSRAYPR